MKIDMCTRVGLSFVVDTGEETRENSVKFIWGVQSWIPGLDELLKGLGIGESATFDLSHGEEEAADQPTTRITVTVESVEPVSQKEVVRALAESVECGCGCGGHSHHH